MIYDTTVELLKLLFGALEFLKPYATIGGVIFLILRQNGIKKIINGHLPRRFRDTHDSDSKEMKLDIKEMKYDIKLLKSHQGVIGEWSNTQQNGQITIPILSYKRFFLFLQMAIHPRRKKLMDKLKSRKFWLTILAALIPVINEEFNINLDLGSIISIMTVIMAGVAAIAHVDAKKILASIVHTKVTVNGLESAFTTFKEAIPYLNEIHSDINKLLDAVKKDDGSQAFKDAMHAYAQIKPILDAIKHPSPVAVIVEDKVAS